MIGPTFVLRTVKDGQVTIYGRQFEPDENHFDYDGRLEGLRFAFGSCRQPSRSTWALWGSEDAWNATRRTASEADQARFERGQCEQPEVVDGAMPWMFWHEVTSDA
jgi:hypothetical protein